MNEANSNTLYAINVYIDTADVDEGCISREEWNALRHRSIFAKSAVTEDTVADYDPAELLAAFKWCAGTLARLVLAVDGAMRERRHDCNLDARGAYDPQGYTCGWRWEEGVILPGRAVDGSEGTPEVSFDVPTEDADKWLVKIRRMLSRIIADGYMLPAEGGHGSDRAHDHIVPSESGKDPRGAASR
jgi:hypothetical protein